MKYRLQDLIDMEHFQNLQDRLNEIYSFPSSIIDNDGNILTATAWQDICTKFHRKNKEAELLCIKSDQYIQSHIHEANPAVSYRCPHGLVDNATPIIIDGIHYGNFFTGQFFLEEPDLNFFKAQAKKYGFDEEAYLEAVNKVPIWTQDQLKSYLFFIKGLIAVISESGLKKLEEMEIRKQIEKSENRHRSILKTAMDGYWLTDTDGLLLEINDAYCEMSGYSQDELLTMHISDLEASESPHLVAKHMNAIILKGSDRFESKHRRKDGTVFDIEVSVQFRPEENGRCVCFLRDITERKQAAEAILDSEQRFRTAFTTSPLAIAISTQQEGIWIDVNQAALDMFGYTREEVVGKSALTTNLWVYQNDRKRIVEKINQGEDVRNQNIQLRLKNGSLIFASVSATAMTLKAIKHILFITENITERKLADEKLRKSEENFRSLAENSNDYIMRYDRQCRHLYINPAGLQVSGMSASDLIGKTHRESRFPEELCNLWEEKIIQVFETADPSQIEFEFSGTNGPEILELRLSPEFDSAGNVCSVLGISRNITERKRAEDALRQSEKRFRTVSRLSSDFAYSCCKICDGSYAVDWITDTFYALTGISEAELNDLQCWMALVHPEDSDRASELLHQLQPGESDTRDFRIVTKDGRVLTITNHMECESDPTVPGGLRIYGSVQNITERKRAEESLKESEAKYRSMMEAMDDAVYICSGDFQIEYMNTAMIKRIGYDASGELCHKAMHGLEEKCPWCIHDKVMDGQFIKTEVVSPKDNRTYHVSNSPIFHLHGAVSKLTILRDITETKKTEERLLQGQKMEAIGLLAGGIAHDLNNILFPISGFSEMLLDEISPDNNAHRSIEQIYKSAKRGSDLVNQILAFSRQSNLQKLPILIQPILKEVLKLVRATIPKNIELTSHINKDCGRIFADPTQIHQIAMNLITNAYHAVEQKGGTINVELKETEFGRDDLQDISMEPGKYACITVSDTGTGIDRSLIDKIFDPYFTTKEQGKGTGLGLSVVLGIVNGHGGDVRVDSHVGKGTIFNVYLPLDKNTAYAKTAAVVRQYPTGTENILLVDDEEPITRMVQKMLEKLGYQVIARTSSLDALGAFRENPSKFDMVISDKGMPDMTGLQLAGELISIRQDIPIIICTGFRDESDEQHAKSLGVKGLLKKPVGIGNLAEMVRKVLDEA